MLLLPRNDAKRQSPSSGPGISQGHSGQGRGYLVSSTVQQRQPGIPQGIIVILAGFLPILAIVSMFPAVGAMIGHFAPIDPDAATKVPSMVTAPGLAIAVTALFMGLLVDRYGRRKLVLVSTFSYGFIGVIPFFLEDLDWIYASRLLLGFSEAAILTTVNTLIADYWAEEGRRRWLTLQGMIGPAFSSIMIFFAGTLTAWRWNGIFLLYLLAIPIAIAMWRYMYEPESDATVRRNLGMDETGEGTAFPWKTMFEIAILTLFSSAIYYVFIVNGSVVWEELGVTDPESIGQITALPTLFILVGAGLFWLLGRKGFSFRVQVATFLTLLGAGLALMGYTSNWQGMVAGMALQQTGAGMSILTLIAWAQSRLPFAHRGRGMGIWTATFFFGQFSSPLAVSALRGQLGSMQAAFAAMGLVAIAGAVIFFFALGRTRAEDEEQLVGAVAKEGPVP
ncbi:MFS transporter [uncultured Croceicoccus sp.]|uniref:MFS transporter n=1 Tax=uncultured Croceicoccus sp. TaxID=1295329 RepID=UPI0026052D46|nr:MFS transporter [uncultured Croceicoccus sp.]